MRDHSWMKTCSACALILAAAGCGAPGNNMAGNDAEAAAGNEAAPVEDNAALGANVAAPADNVSTASDATYRAAGSEPFWSLTIDGQMVYHPADGPDVTVATPSPQSTRVGPMYVTSGLTVRINQFQHCTEPSGAVRHDTVTVTIGAQTLTGCGGAETRAAE